MKLKALFICLLLCALVSSSGATLIDFETVPEGQNPQAVNVYIGDTYDSLGVDLWSKSNVHPRWNYNVYNNSGWFVIGGYQTPPYFPDTSHIGMTFVSPMTEVSMDLFSLYSIQFWVYDTDNQLIPGVVSINPNGGWMTKTITAPQDKTIWKIELQGTVNGAVVAMDNLYFIPEPATVFLLGAGAMMFRKRRG